MPDHELYRASVLTPWTGDGLTMQTAFRPLVAVAHQVASCRVLSGTPGDGDDAAVELVCTPDVLNAIEADERFSLVGESHWTSPEGP
jgi:hypothetical protein